MAKVAEKVAGKKDRFIWSRKSLGCRSGAQKYRPTFG